jgi:hypothetical protein
MHLSTKSGQGQIDTNLPKLFFLDILLDGVQHFLQADLKKAHAT